MRLEVGGCAPSTGTYWLKLTAEWKMLGCALNLLWRFSEVFASSPSLVFSPLFILPLDRALIFGAVFCFLYFPISYMYDDLLLFHILDYCPCLLESGRCFSE